MIILGISWGWAELVSGCSHRSVVSGNREGVALRGAAKITVHWFRYRGRGNVARMRATSFNVTKRVREGCWGISKSESLIPPCTPGNRSWGSCTIHRTVREGGTGVTKRTYASGRSLFCVDLLVQSCDPDP